MLGTTIVVLLIGSMMLWSEGVVRGSRLVGFGRSSDPDGIAWWPFIGAGFVAGAVAELINAQFMVTGELVMAGLTGG
jgi:hypothetical protein